jgi:hypothetical protein
MAPVASRHRAVMQLGDSAPLYMHSNSTDRSVTSIVSSTMNAEPIMDVHCIATGYRRKVDEGMAELEVHFYQEKLVEEKKCTITVSIPSFWTSRMYLGAVSLSLQKHNILSVSSVLFPRTNTNVSSVNEIHWLFISTANEVSDLMNRRCVFLHIRGGVFI